MKSDARNKYIVNKRFLCLFHSLNDADKKEMCIFLSDKKNEDKLYSMLAQQNEKINEIYKRSKKDTFGKAVLANVTGDAVWTIAERVLLKLFK